MRINNRTTTARSYILDKAILQEFALTPAGKTNNVRMKFSNLRRNVELRIKPRGTRPA
jgi:hypothetical protein